MDMMLLSASILFLEEIIVPCCWTVIDNGSNPWSQDWAAVMSEAPHWHISQGPTAVSFFNGCMDRKRKFFFFLWVAKQGK